MTPSPGIASSPLPPLPDISGSSAGVTPPQSDAMSAMMSGVAPVKGAVDQILSAAKTIVQSGAVPGAEQVCGQIIALATSLLPMAIQQALQPGMGGGSGGAAPQGSIPPLGGQ